VDGGTVVAAEVSDDEVVAAEVSDDEVVAAEVSDDEVVAAEVSDDEVGLSGNSQPVGLSGSTPVPVKSAWAAPNGLGTVSTAIR
jgi:hypothetical protein